MASRKGGHQRVGPIPSFLPASRGEENGRYNGGTESRTQSQLRPQPETKRYKTTHKKKSRKSTTYPLRILFCRVGEHDKLRNELPLIRGQRHLGGGNRQFRFNATARLVVNFLIYRAIGLEVFAAGYRECEQKLFPLKTKRFVLSGDFLFSAPIGCWRPSFSCFCPTLPASFSSGLGIYFR